MKINAGTILIYRVFDIAEEIDLARVDALLTERARLGRLQLKRDPRKSIIVRDAPLSLRLEDTSLRLAEKFYAAEVIAKFWPYGVLTLQFQIPIPEGTSWEQLVDIAAVIENDRDIDTTAQRISQTLSHELKTALKHPNEWEVFEDYVIFFLEKISGIKKAKDLLTEGNIPALILAENKETLSAEFCQGILDNVFQYGENDMAVIDWNSAMIYEPSGTRDIPDVIGFALTHLLEMRYYDDLIDTKLVTLYDAIEAGKQKLIQRNVSNLSKEASTRYIEFSEFIERVENSFKIVGDSYLATVFRAATRRFRFNDWQQNINRKMGILAQISQLLEGQMNVRRSLALEAIIVLLILFEIVSAFLRH